MPGPSLRSSSRSGVRDHGQWALRLPQKGLTELPESRSLTLKPFDFRSDCLRERWAGGNSAQPAELVFQMLFGLRGHVPDDLLGLESGDEISGDGHRPTKRISA